MHVYNHFTTNYLLLFLFHLAWSDRGAGPAGGVPRAKVGGVSTGEQHQGHPRLHHRRRGGPF